MNSNLKLLSNLFLLFFAFFTSQATQAQTNISAEASLQNRSMALGQSNSYTITLRNTSNVPNMDPPKVPGLVFGSSSSTRSSTSIVNGVASRETSVSWTFQAERPGTYTIPARTLQIQGHNISVNAMQIVVSEMPTEMRNRFFLRWDLPDGPYYVGQAIPAKLQLYLRSGINARLGSHPDGSSDQFIRTEFAGDPRQNQVRVDGQIYTVVEWDSVITPIRSGTGDLPVNLVLVYETGQMQRDFFGSRPIQEQIRLVTESQSWEVRDIPRTDRPASFSGAVGQFDVEARLSERNVLVGDPITVTLEVSGVGNFERIRAPEFKSSDGWRIYPPRSQMREEEVPYRGVKTFEYILTPTSEQVDQVPSIAFSWFEAETAAWREIIMDPEPITVRREPSASPGALAGTDSNEFGEMDPNSRLYPLATSLGRSDSLQSVWHRPAFWALNGAFTVGFAFALIAMVRRERAARNPYLQVRSEAARKAKDLATAAIKAANTNNAMEFYTLARQSLRHFLAYLDPQTHNADSLTWDELEAILLKFEFDDSTLKNMQRLFERKDAVQFAGWKPETDELTSDRQQFEGLLNVIVTRKEYQ
jgi:hypothetical protein